jgi:PAS domain S-box-containing protein
MSETGQLMIDHDGKIIGVDRGFCDLVRREPDELVGINILDITAPGDRRECELALAEMVRTQRKVHATKRYLRGDGTTVWAEATASLVLRADFPGCAILHAAPIIDTRESRHPARLLTAARSLRGQDRARIDVVANSMLPAWGAILAAYIAEAEGRAFPAGSNDLFGFASAASLARWTMALVDEGIFEVETRNLVPDAEKSYRLTAQTQDRLEAYLHTVVEDVATPVTVYTN